MLKDIFFKSLKLFFIILFLNFKSFANENTSNCSWDNKNDIPCIKINSPISNNSEYSNYGNTKIIITKKQINELGAIDLIDVLKLVPDINISQSGPKGQQASMFMRGTNSNHTLVMINGVPINDQSTTQGLHDFGVDFIQTIQQVEIYPGASSTNFGSNSVGGAVNIVLTGDYKDQISLMGDPNANYEFFANKNLIDGNSSLNIKIGSVEHETISARGNLDDEGDKVKNYTTNVNYENIINLNSKIYSTAYIRQTIAEYDNSPTDQFGYRGDNRMGMFQIGLENLQKKQRTNYLLYYNVYDREYNEKNVIDNYDSEVLGFKYDLSKTLNNKISFGLGSEYKYDWGEFNNRGSYQASTKGNNDNLSVYSNIGFNVFENTNLSLFLRNDKNKAASNNSTYKINLNQQINKFNFGISRMTGLRNPSLYELFGVDNYGFSGNRSLNAESSLTNEIYTNFNFNENFKFSTKFFRSNINNNIEYINNTYVNDNDDVDLTQSGINSDLSFRNSDLNFNIFSSFLSSKSEDKSDQTRRPEKTYGFNLTKKNNNVLFGDYNLNISYNHYGKHFDVHSVNFSTIEMDSTDIINLNLIKNLNKNTSIYLRLSNLFDETYQRPHGYNQEKREIKFGMKY